MSGYAKKMKENHNSPILLTSEEKDFLFSNKAYASNGDFSGCSDSQIRNTQLIDSVLHNKNALLGFYKKFLNTKVLLSLLVLLSLACSALVLTPLSLFFPILFYSIGIMMILGFHSAYGSLLGDSFSKGSFVVETLLEELDYKSELKPYDKEVNDLMNLLEVLTQNKEVQEDQEVLNDFILRKMRDGYRAKDILFEMCIYYSSRFLERRSGQYPEIESISSNFKKIMLSEKKRILEDM